MGHFPVTCVKAGNIALGISWLYVRSRFPKLPFTCFVEELVLMRNLSFLDYSCPSSSLLVHIIEKFPGTRVVSSKLSVAPLLIAP